MVDELTAHLKDLDVYQFCQDVKGCPYIAGGSATVNSADALPHSGPRGTIFKLEADLSVASELSAGEFGWLVHFPEFPKYLPTYEAEVHDPVPPTPHFSAGMRFNATDVPPSQAVPFGRFYPKGIYTAQLHVCGGDCGDVGPKHPHFEIYAAANVTFEIV
mmetsp:Transcript_5560/g.19113  ORF Transcript_5560/g.19113 Transcript_5560/m.19113 type:complete len:160 (+) Transcript_5560:353-832(+)